MAKHIWESKTAKPATIAGMREAYNLAIEQGYTHLQAATFAGYRAERQRQGNSGYNNLKTHLTAVARYWRIMGGKNAASYRQAYYTLALVADDIVTVLWNKVQNDDADFVRQFECGDSILALSLDSFDDFARGLTRLGIA